MPQGDGGVLLCTRGFNPIEALVEDALEVGVPPDTGDTVEAFTNFIDRLLTQVDCSPSGAPSRPHTSEARALGPGSCAWANPCLPNHVARCPWRVWRRVLAQGGPCSLRVRGARACRHAWS